MSPARHPLERATRATLFHSNAPSSRSSRISTCPSGCLTVWPRLKQSPLCMNFVDQRQSKQVNWWPQAEAGPVKLLLIDPEIDWMSINLIWRRRAMQSLQCLLIRGHSAYCNNNNNNNSNCSLHKLCKLLSNYWLTYNFQPLVLLAKRRSTQTSILTANKVETKRESERGKAPLNEQVFADLLEWLRAGKRIGSSAIIHLGLSSSYFAPAAASHRIWALNESTNPLTNLIQPIEWKVYSFS